MSEPLPQPNLPLPIKRLEESLVNRIAAGEIIHRPASALKELIENSLDAGATQIKITVKDGGLKLLQIQDNGCGIRKADLPILCERFTTSKLSTFSDLQRIQTYGFRGEALASISHVAHLSVVTKTKEEACAWKVYYANGSLKDEDPKPCAGNIGTIITAEDLFFNTPTRLAALRSTSDEYARILDIVTRYSVHNPEVAFTCKKAGSSSPDLSTPGSSSVSSIIKLVHGSTVAKNLLYVVALPAVQVPEGTSGAIPCHDAAKWKAEAYITSPNYQAKKMTFLLFINHRSVESTRIKRTLENVYAAILPKGTFPFIYLSLEIEPSQVDVNVHPTKREVHFMNEDEITGAIANIVQERLTEQNSRSFELQKSSLQSRPPISEAMRHPRQSMEKLREEDNNKSITEASVDAEPFHNTSARSKRLPPQYKVRTSLADRTLDSMFPIIDQSHALHGSGDGSPLEYSPSTAASTKSEISESVCTLSSIKKLRQEMEDEVHSELVDIMSEHIFVGIVDFKHGLTLLQHSTKLYLVNHGTMCQELFYQLGLRQFGNYHRVKLSPPPSITALIQLAVEAEGERVQASGMKPSHMAEKIVRILMAKKDMLREYFSLAINEAGELESLPILLRDYVPNLDRLPLFLMRLGPEIQWAEETSCFKSFLRELAFFYSSGPNEGKDDGMTGEEQAQRWRVQHVLFPLLRKYLRPPRAFLDHDVLQVADLPDLYRVFERC